MHTYLYFDLWVGLDEKSQGCQSHYDSSSGIMNVCTNFHGNPSSCHKLRPTDSYSLDTAAKKHILYVLNSLSDMMWAMKYEKNMHK